MTTNPVTSLEARVKRCTTRELNSVELIIDEVQRLTQLSWLIVFVSAEAFFTPSSGTKNG